MHIKNNKAWLFILSTSNPIKLLYCMDCMDEKYRESLPSPLATWQCGLAKGLPKCPKARNRERLISIKILFCGDSISKHITLERGSGPGDMLCSESITKLLQPLSRH